MSYSEQTVHFQCEGEPLLGILSLPEQPKPLAVVVVVGGPQYRAGSHRQFVALARALASDGYPVLRFDQRGMGDSGGAPRTFEMIDADIAAAIDACLAKLPPAVSQVALWGLCDGASAALMYASRRADARLQGLFLVNPWVRSEQSLSRARLKQYYVDRILQRSFWAKLLKGQVGGGALSGLLGHCRRALQRAPAQPAAAQTPSHTNQANQANAQPFQRVMLTGWQQYADRLQLVLSGRDLTAKEFQEYTQADRAWAAVMKKAQPQVHHASAADHTFSDAASMRQLNDWTRLWLDQLVEQLAHRQAAAKSPPSSTLASA